jgi:hypothetical protein
MYTTYFRPSTFYHHQPTYHFRVPTFVQARVNHSGSEHAFVSSDRHTYKFRLSGLILGSLILICTLGLLTIELSRLYAGSNNRVHEHVVNRSSDTFIYSNVIPIYNDSRWNMKIENRSIWPWSTATLLFSLLFLTTGLIGIISGQRETYATILAFLVCSLLSLCLIVFLLVSYSTTITGWRTIYGKGNDYAMSRYARIDRDLAIVCLCLCCFLWILQVLSVILACRTIEICRQKTFDHGENLSRNPID